MKKAKGIHLIPYTIKGSFKASRCPVSNHLIANVLDHVATQIAGVAEAGVALQTHARLLPGVSPHVDL